MEFRDIAHRFAFHRATTKEKSEAHGSIRARIGDVAHALNGELPEGREKSLAITKLEESMFWANASIARNNDEVLDATIR